MKTLDRALRIAGGALILVEGVYFMIAPGAIPDELIFLAGLAILLPAGAHYILSTLLEIAEDGAKRRRATVGRHWVPLAGMRVADIVAAQPGQWVCINGHLNEAKNNRCSKCGARRP